MIEYAGFRQRLLAALIDAVILGATAAVLLPIVSHIIDVILRRGEYGLSSLGWEYGLAAGILNFIDSLAVAYWPAHFIYQVAGLVDSNWRSPSEWYTPGNVSASLIGLLLNCLYHAGMESSARRATLGKRWLQVRVTSYQGEQISFARASARHFLKAVISFPATLMLQFSTMSTGVGLPLWILAVLPAFLPVLFTQKKQALHDLLARCIVVKVVV